MGILRFEKGRKFLLMPLRPATILSSEDFF